jgi:hypothetical protein
MSMTGEGKILLVDSKYVISSPTNSFGTQLSHKLSSICALNIIIITSV